MARLIIDGFETVEDAEAYAHWFEGSGEQYASPWMDENNSGRTILTDVGKEEGWIKNDGDDVVIYVKTYI